jgi:hypothetical protein
MFATFARKILGDLLAQCIVATGQAFWSGW